MEKNHEQIAQILVQKFTQEINEELILLNADEHDCLIKNLDFIGDGVVSDCVITLVEQLVNFDRHEEDLE